MIQIIVKYNQLIFSEEELNKTSKREKILSFLTYILKGELINKNGVIINSESKDVNDFKKELKDILDKNKIKSIDLGVNFRAIEMFSLNLLSCSSSIFLQKDKDKFTLSFFHPTVDLNLKNSSMISPLKIKDLKQKDFKREDYELDDTDNLDFALEYSDYYKKLLYQLPKGKNKKTSVCVIIKPELFPPLKKICSMFKGSLNINLLSDDGNALNNIKTGKFDLIFEIDNRKEYPKIYDSDKSELNNIFKFLLAFEGFNNMNPNYLTTFNTNKKGNFINFLNFQNNYHIFNYVQLNIFSGNVKYVNQKMETTNNPYNFTSREILSYLDSNKGVSTNTNFLFFDSLNNFFYMLNYVIYYDPYNKKSDSLISHLSKITKKLMNYDVYPKIYFSCYTEKVWYILDYMDYLLREEIKIHGKKYKEEDINFLMNDLFCIKVSIEEDKKSTDKDVKLFYPKHKPKTNLNRKYIEKVIGVSANPNLFDEKEEDKEVFSVLIECGDKLKEIINPMDLYNLLFNILKDATSQHGSSDTERYLSKNIPKYSKEIKSIFKRKNPPSSKPVKTKTIYDLFLV